MSSSTEQQQQGLGGDGGRQQQLSISPTPPTPGNLGESIFHSEDVPPTLAEVVVPILRAANEVESSNLHVAYLCRLHAFQRAHRLDPSSRGRGVRKYKIALLQGIEREAALRVRVENIDVKEIHSFYLQYYNKYIQALQIATDKSDLVQLKQTYQTAVVLYEVLKDCKAQYEPQSGVAAKDDESASCSNPHGTN